MKQFPGLANYISAKMPAFEDCKLKGITDDEVTPKLKILFRGSEYSVKNHTEQFLLKSYHLSAIKKGAVSFPYLWFLVISDGYS